MCELDQPLRTSERDKLAAAVAETDANRRTMTTQMLLEWAEQVRRTSDMIDLIVAGELSVTLRGGNLAFTPVAKTAAEIHHLAGRTC